uniref:Uncharacterized protein n=1 Tax=Lotharella globosa TaxID=91324 RepID=A0A7S3YYX3_9EUKA
MSVVLDRTVRIWAASALGTQDGDTIGIGACLRVIEGHSGNVTCCDWSTCWKFLVTTSDDQTIRFWNVEDGSCLKIFNGHLAPVVSCNLSRRGNRLVTASRDRTVRLWAVNMIKKDETAETKASERKGDAAAEAKETQVQDSAELKASTAPEKKASKKDPSATVKEQIMSSTSVATTPSIVFSPESKEKKNEPASSMKQKVQSIRDDEAKAKSEIDSALHRERNEVKEEREQANTDTRNIAVSGPRIVPEEAEAADNRGVGALEGDKDYQSVAEEAVLHADNDGDLETGTTNEEDTEIDEGAANDQGDEPGHILEGEQPDQSKPNVDNSEDAETVDARASLLKLEGKAFRCTKCNAVGWAVGGEVNCPRACIEDSDAHDWTLDARSKEASGAIDSQCCECKVQLCVVS